jgi:drug/metabolite transporter (DMT)-like permease
MTIPNQLLLIAFSCRMSIGQLLFKYGASNTTTTGVQRDTISTFLQPTILLGLLVYGGATILWIKLLQSIPLSTAYPYASLAFVLVPICSKFLIGEWLTLQYALGMCLIVGGILVIGLDRASVASTQVSACSLNERIEKS